MLPFSLDKKNKTNLPRENTLFRPSKKVINEKVKKSPKIDEKMTRDQAGEREFP